MRRQLVISLALFALGTVVYLLQSGAPPRVHFVAVPLQCLLLVGGVALAWSRSLQRSRRVLALLLLVGVMGPIWAYAMSTVVLKLEPFSPAFLMPVTLALGAELLVFLALVWVLSWGSERLRR